MATKILVALFLFLLVTRCGYVNYQIEIRESQRGFGNWSESQILNTFGDPDEIRNIGENERHFVYFGRKKLMKGVRLNGFPTINLTWFSDIEEKIYVETDSTFRKELEKVQVVHFLNYMCGNMSGHGDFCGASRGVDIRRFEGDGFGEVFNK